MFNILNPKYSFPPQPLVMEACAELARRLVNGENVVSGGNGDAAPGTMDGWVNHPLKSFRELTLMEMAG